MCVRYLYDETRRMRYKTTELIIDEAHWQPPPRPNYPPLALVPIRINIDEPKLQDLARKAGARWDPAQKLWWVQFGNIVGTRLEKRIAIETKKNS